MGPGRNAVDGVRQLLETRLAELAEEQRRLEGVLGELEEETLRRRGRPHKHKSLAASTVRRRRKRGGVTRAEQALELVRKEPGIEARRVAKAMQIKPTYVYTVLGGLEREGRIKKERRRYFVPR